MAAIDVLKCLSYRLACSSSALHMVWRKEDKGKKYKEAFISIADIKGKEIKRMPVELKQGMNEVIYEHGYGASGIFTYTLMIDGRVIESKKMIFSN